MRRIARRLWMKRVLLLAAAAPVNVWASPSPQTAMATSSDAPSYPPVRPRTLNFPRDFGAHPDYRTEWWYMTGWLGQGAQAIGFQVTFFRSRTLHPESNPSRFAPRQLMFAHAALALPHEGKLLHAEIAGRAGPAGAAFDIADTGLELAGWRLYRTADDRYKLAITTDDFNLSLEATPPKEPVLRGDEGYSLKGPSPELASYYYSRPQLKVLAQLEIKGSKGGPDGNTRKSTRRTQQRLSLSGSAWFDHEWSSSLLMSGAVGWDWIGINLLDGSSLMAFRIRDAADKTLFAEWDWRDAQGRVLEKHQDVSWEPIGQWRSPRSLVTYPESFKLRVAQREWTLQPLMADQEVDARASTGGFYYEGAVELKENDKTLGRGYLELTGYGVPLVL